MTYKTGCRVRIIRREEWSPFQKGDIGFVTGPHPHMDRYVSIVRTVNSKDNGHNQWNFKLGSVEPYPKTIIIMEK